MKKLWLLLSLAILFFFTSCSEDDPLTPLPTTNVEGVFILNEGKFGEDNASFSLYDFNTQKVTHDVFKTANNLVLGDNAQSMIVLGDKALIAMYGSKQIIIMNLLDYKEEARINLTKGPRYMAIVDAQTIYATGYDASGNGGVFKIDLETKSILKEIPVGNNPEQLTFTKNKLYVAIGGWGNERIVSVIDVNKDEKIKDIKVGYNTGRITTLNDYVYAVSTGGWGEGQGIIGLYKINTSEDSIVDSLKENISYPGMIIPFENQLLLGTSAGVLLVNPQNLTIERTLIESTDIVVGGTQWSSVYGISYDEKTEKIYCGNPKDFNQNGDVAVFDKSGVLLERIECGVLPNTIIVSKK